MTTTAKIYNPVLMGARWRHRKGGTYRVLATGRIESDLSPCVIYVSEQDEVVWVRPFTEFNDGRFTCIDDEAKK